MIYYVEYTLTNYETPRGVQVCASNKREAWQKATFEEIPNKEGQQPFSSWVSSVTYQNGNYKRFNTFSGKPY